MLVLSVAPRDANWKYRLRTDPYPYSNPSFDLSVEKSPWKCSTACPVNQDEKPQKTDPFPFRDLPEKAPLDFPSSVLEL